MATRVSVPGIPVMQVAPARRASARIQLLGDVHGALVGLSVPLRLRDLSDGGFAMESVLQFPAQAQHLFELTLDGDDGPATIVKARATHAEPAGEGHAPGTVVSGFAFSEDQPHTTRERITALVTMARAMVEAHGPADAPVAESGAERRTTTRLNVLGEMLGEVLTTGAPLLVRDFSEGGCSVETHMELPAGSEHAVRLELTDSLAVSIKARVVHSRRHAEAGRPARYVSGLEFVDPVGQSQREIAEMLGLLTKAPRR